MLGTAAGIYPLRRLGAAGSSSRDGSPRALPPVSYTRSHSHEQKPRRPSFGTPKGLLMYNCAVGHPPVHQKAVSCTNRIFLPAISSRGTEIHDDTERPVHGRARFACFSVPPVVTLTRTGPICCVYRPDRAVQRLQTAAKANAERRQRQRRTQWRRRRRREPPQAEAGFPA